VRLDVQRVELSEIINAAMEGVKPTAETKGVRLEKVIDRLVGSISGDPARLQQVLWNLLTNAIKFTSKGGKVRVLAEVMQSHVEISVADTGEGINPDFLPIFSSDSARPMVRQSGSIAGWGSGCPS